MTARILCIGGATVDRTYRLAAPLVPETSNPAAAALAFGGVARNVAENLCRLGIAAELLSRVGDDAAGQALLRHLDAAGVGRRGTEVAAGEATAEYVAVLTPGGDLALGLAAMAVLDGLTPEIIERQGGLLADAAWIFADCNLPAESLLALAARRWGGRYRLAVDAVSVAKAARLPDDLRGIDLLFVNRDEAAAATARGGRTAREPTRMAADLTAAGAGSAVVTLGPDGAVLVDSAGIAAVPAERAQVVDVTGAGDALIAATLAALLSGQPLAEAVGRGCAAAARAVATPSATGTALPQSPDAQLGHLSGSQKR